MGRELQRNSEEYYDAAVIPVQVSHLLSFSGIAKVINFSLK
jgi:hypothetical protein